MGRESGKTGIYHLIAVCAGVILAFALAMDLAGERALYHMRFNLGMIDREPIKEDLIRTVKQFDRMYVALFTSGGEYANLNDMPAANSLKRRLVQDVNSWILKGRILSHDRHALNIRKVEIIKSDFATVETDENWVLLLRSRETGKRLGSQKQNLIKVRYILTDKGGVWNVLDFEVYAPDSPVPPLSKAWMRGK